MPDTPLVVRVTGSQFNWQIAYPGADGRFGTADDYGQENLMRAPVGRPVRVILTAKDVIHSFFVPQMRLKQDAVPGREVMVWFEATKVGSYEIPCAELCGFGHSQMKGELRVLSVADFNEWAAGEEGLPRGGPMTQPPPAAHGHAHHEPGFLRKYIFSTDHKMIGKQFLWISLFMMILGGSLAMIVRVRSSPGRGRPCRVWDGCPSRTSVRGS